MVKNRIVYIVALVAMLLTTSCSVKKNNSLSRFYYDYTTRFNIYFNGNESYKEALRTMEDTYEDDYSRLVHIHPVAARANPKEKQPGGSFDRAIEKCQKAIKTRSLKTRPSRKAEKMRDPVYKEFVNRDEYNPYIHNAWMMLGKSEFYKGDFLTAISTFNYIARHFTWLPVTVSEAKLYTALAYAHMGWLYEAEDVIYKLNNEKLPPEVTPLFLLANATLLLQKKEYAKTIPYLTQVIDQEKSSKQKIRMTFLLAQLYTLTGEKQTAYKTYSKVIAMNPPYRTEFNARIKQSEVFAGNEGEKSLKKLNKMVKESKNKEYLDQIYYALGNLYLAKKDTALAEKNYLLGVEKSVRNEYDKALNQLVLGEIYFKRNLYHKAQPQYAEALPLIDIRYPNYEKLKLRSQILDEMAVFAQNVALQDSLLIVAALPEKERMELIEKRIADVIAAEKKAKKEAALETMMTQSEGNAPNFTNNVNTPNLNATMGGDKSWYFYNTAMITAGKSDFQKRWGKRKLEDDWRRRNKAAFSNTDFENATTEGTKPTTTVDAELKNKEKENSASQDSVPEISTDVKSVEYYIQQLPLTPEAVKNANEIIADGIYNMALLLADKLEDFPSSLTNYQLLNRRYPTNEYREKAYYHQYLIYMRMGNEIAANAMKDSLISLFPTSAYSVALADPHYMENLRNMKQMQDSIYTATYNAYLANDGKKVQENATMMFNNYSLSPILHKFMFLDALSCITMGQPEQFKERLNLLLERYPDSDVSPLAADMLKGMAQGKKIESKGAVSSQIIWEMQLKGDTAIAANDSIAKKPTYTHIPQSPHIVALVFNTEKVTANKLLFDVANFNFTRFVVNDFDLDIAYFSTVGILLVKGFINFDQTLQYIDILKNSNIIPSQEEVKEIPISADNYQQLTNGNSIESYLRFLEEIKK